MVTRIIDVSVDEAEVQRQREEDEKTEGDVFEVHVANFCVIDAPYSMLPLPSGADALVAGLIVRELEL